MGGFSDFDEIDAVGVTVRGEGEFVAVGFKRIDLLAQGIVEAYRAEVFSLQGHIVVGGVGEQAPFVRKFVDIDLGAIVLLKTLLLQGIDDGLGIADGP